MTLYMLGEFQNIKWEEKDDDLIEEKDRERARFLL